MVRRLGLIACFVLFAAAARAQESLGALTLYGPDGTDKHSVMIESMYFVLQPTDAPAVSPGSDDHDQRSFTVTGRVNAPDVALIAWLVGPDKKRRVTLHIQDDADNAGGSTYELLGARLLGMTVGYSGGGTGNQTLSIDVEHLTINGNKVY